MKHIKEMNKIADYISVLDVDECELTVEMLNTRLKEARKQKAILKIRDVCIDVAAEIDTSLETIMEVHYLDETTGERETEEVTLSDVIHWIETNYM